MALTIKPLSALFLLPPLKSFKFLSPLSRIIASPERWHTFFQDIFSDIQSCPLCAQIMFLIHSSVPYFHHLGMWFLSCFSIPVTPSSRLSFTDSSLSLPELNWVTSVGSWGSIPRQCPRKVSGWRAFVTSSPYGFMVAGATYQLPPVGQGPCWAQEI